MGNKQPPTGNLFPESADVADKPAGSITAQQIAALKMKQKPKGNLFDDITIVNNI